MGQFMRKTIKKTHFKHNNDDNTDKSNKRKKNQ